MVTIAEFSIPTESFALAETLPDFPAVTVEIDRIAAHVPGSTMPCVWVTDGNAPGFADAVHADRTVETVLATAEFDCERLYHIQWSDEIERLVTAMIDHEGVILEAAGSDESWRLRIRFMTRDQLEDFQTHFDEHGPRFRLDQLFEAKHPRHTRGNVTSDQYRALRIATELGYFRVPRDATLQDVADHLGVSHQSVSEVLRRGTENLVRDMLAVEPPSERS